MCPRVRFGSTRGPACLLLSSLAAAGGGITFFIEGKR
jgi:hypothetical protein